MCVVCVTAIRVIVHSGGQNQQHFRDGELWCTVRHAHPQFGVLQQLLEPACGIGIR
jgi:hypothetical protein